MYESAYSEKLRDPRWQRKRLEIFQRDDFKCLNCGDDKKTLHVHHLAYSKNPWDCPSNLLETLCQPCHDRRSDFDEFWGERLTIPTVAIFALFRLFEVNPPSLADENSQLRRIILRDVLLKRAANGEFKLTQKFYDHFPPVENHTTTLSGPGLTPLAHTITRDPAAESPQAVAQPDLGATARSVSPISMPIPNGASAPDLPAS